MDLAEIASARLGRSAPFWLARPPTVDEVEEHEAAYGIEADPTSDSRSAGRWFVFDPMALENQWHWVLLTICGRRRRPESTTFDRLDGSRIYVAPAHEVGEDTWVPLLSVEEWASKILWRPATRRGIAIAVGREEVDEVAVLEAIVTLGRRVGLTEEWELLSRCLRELLARRGEESARAA